MLINYIEGMITRTCDADGNWQSPIVACVRKSFEKVIDKVSTAILLLVSLISAYTVHTVADH